MKRRVIAKTESLLRHRFLVPAGFTGLYLLWAWLRFFSPLYNFAPYAVLAVGLLWLALAWRIVPRLIGGLHRVGAFVFLLVMLLSNSWYFPNDVDLRAWVTPPDYMDKSVEQLNASQLSSMPVVAGSVIRIQTSSDPELHVSFDSKRYDALDEDGVLALTVPEVKAGYRADLVAYKKWHRLRHWSLRIVPDKAPRIKITNKPFVTTRQTVRLSYKAQDDFGVQHIYVRVAPKKALQEDTPINVLVSSPQAKKVQATSYVELSSLPWAGRDVALRLFAVDGAGHETFGETTYLKLPKRRFLHPFARALIDVRDKLLQDPSKAVRHETANVMAGIARQQGKFQKDITTVLALRSGAVRLVIGQDEGIIQKTTALLWQTAIRLEEGMLGLRREKLAHIYAETLGALSLSPEPARVKALLGSLSHASDKYYKILEMEQSPVASVMQAYANVSFDGNEASSRDHFQARLEEIEIAVKAGKKGALKKSLATMHDLIENLPTILPELTSAQDELAAQLSSTHLLVKAQNKLLKITDILIKRKKREPKKSVWRDVLKLRDDQRDLLMALRKMVTQSKLSFMEMKDAQHALDGALNALAASKLSLAYKQQQEAAALLENVVLILSEKMQSSLAASAVCMPSVR